MREKRWHIVFTQHHIYLHIKKKTTFTMIGNFFFYCISVLYLQWTKATTRIKRWTRKHCDDRRIQKFKLCAQALLERAHLTSSYFPLDLHERFLNGVCEIISRAFAIIVYDDDDGCIKGDFNYVIFNLEFLLFKGLMSIVSALYNCWEWGQNRFLFQQKKKQKIETKEEYAR